MIIFEQSKILEQYGLISQSGREVRFSLARVLMMHIAITAAYSADNYKHPSIITGSIVCICLILLSVSCAQRVY